MRQNSSKNVTLVQKILVNVTSRALITTLTFKLWTNYIRPKKLKRKRERERERKRERKRESVCVYGWQKGFGCMAIQFIERDSVSRERICVCLCFDLYEKPPRQIVKCEGLMSSVTR